MSHINVTINGRQYRMACEEGQEVRLLKLAENLEQRIETLRGKFGEIGDARLTVMASLTGTVRELIDPTIRTTVDDDEVHRIRDDLAALVARLRTAQLPGPAGIRYNAELRSWNWGNAVMGAANAIAPPTMARSMPRNSPPRLEAGKDTMPSTIPAML